MIAVSLRIRRESKDSESTPKDIVSARVSLSRSPVNRVLTKMDQARLLRCRRTRGGTALLDDVDTLRSARSFISDALNSYRQMRLRPSAERGLRHLFLIPT
jgi:DNA-binding IscR family transcriptional regulator